MHTKGMQPGFNEDQPRGSPRYNENDLVKYVFFIKIWLGDIDEISGERPIRGRILYIPMDEQKTDSKKEKRYTKGFTDLDQIIEFISKYIKPDQSVGKV